MPNEAVSPLLGVEAAGDELEAGVLAARQLLVLQHAHGRRGGRLARAAPHHPALAPSKGVNGIFTMCLLTFLPIGEYIYSQATQFYMSSRVPVLKEERACMY